MAKEKKSILDIIRQRIATSSGASNTFFRIRAGEKKRIRFLSEMTDAVLVTVHDKWGEVNTPCLKYFGKKCQYCSRDDVRTRDNFVWSVFDYEAKEVKLFAFKANDKSPVPQMLAMYDQYGTITDRDYVLSRKGERFDTAYTLVPLDKSKFAGAKKFKPFKESEIFAEYKKLADLNDDDLDGIFDEEENDDDVEEEDEDEEDEE